MLLRAKYARNDYLQVSVVWLKYLKRMIQKSVNGQDFMEMF